MKQILHLLEFIILSILFVILQLIPINFVSLIGGKIFQIFGPLSQSHRVTILNLKKVYPKMKKKELIIYALKSWENFGRTLFELSILNKILNKKNNRIKILGTNYLDQINKKNEQVIFFGIHESNWELILPTLDKLGFRVGAIYRHINNPYINKLILKKRINTLQSKDTFYTPKGRESAKDLLLAINKGLSILVLIDQKDSAGSYVKLFNYDVKTQLGFLKIAKKNNFKLIPIQNIRKKINNFSIIFHPPINPFKNNQNEIQVMSEIHKLIEKWIKENPYQWLWQHNRFN